MTKIFEWTLVTKRIQKINVGVGLGIGDVVGIVIDDLLGIDVGESHRQSYWGRSRKIRW